MTERNYGSGIGTGYGNHGNSIIGTVAIANSKVIGMSSSGANRNYASGIGTGLGSTGTSAIDILTISNANITAVSSATTLDYHSPGIGAGHANNGNATIDILTISNANVAATSSSGAAIGHNGIVGTSRSEVKSLNLIGNVRMVLRPGPQHRPIQAVSLALSNAAVVVLIQEPPLFAETSVTADSFSLAVLYENITSSSDPGLRELPGNWLEIGNLSYPGEPRWTLCIAKNERRRCFDMDFPGADRAKSLAISIPSDGNYSLTAFSDRMSGRFITSSHNGSFEVTPFQSFIPTVQFIPDATQYFTEFSSYTYRAKLIFEIWPFILALEL
jgi:hypothetical protein